MAIFHKFHCFVRDLGLKVHNLNTDTLKVYLTANTPTPAMEIKASLVGITEHNGYTATDILNAYTETGGIGTLTATDVTWTALTGGFGPFRYVVIYNDTPTSPADPLICWMDYESLISKAVNESFEVNFGTSVFTIE